MHHTVTDPFVAEALPHDVPAAADPVLALPAPNPLSAPHHPAPRHDGWTPDRQRRFLEALADGHSVKDACATVALSHQSAYAFRRTARGAAFALGWRAASLIARDTLADALMVRAIEGQVDTVIRDDGSRIQRHRFDNRLAGAMLARLDRLALAETHTGQAEPAARAAAQFDAFLDTLPRQCRPGPDGIVHSPQLPQLRRAPPPRDPPVWWDDVVAAWLTSFPPPDGFDGDETGAVGTPGYRREVTDEELALLERGDFHRFCDALDAAAHDRDRWFADLAARNEAEAGVEAEIAAAARPIVASIPAPGTLSPQRRSTPPAGEADMSIWSKIKEAILPPDTFADKPAAAPQSPPPPPQAPRPAAPAGQQPAAPPPAAAQPQPQPSAPAAAPVDVEAVLSQKAAAKGGGLNWQSSIVDLMKLLDIDSSLDNRKELATELGYTGAKDGSAEMNIWLHKAVMRELAKNGGKVPANLTD